MPVCVCVCHNEKKVPDERQAQAILTIAAITTQRKTQVCVCMWCACTARARACVCVGGGGGRKSFFLSRTEYYEKHYRSELKSCLFYAEGDEQWTHLPSLCSLCKRHLELTRATKARLEASQSLRVQYLGNCSCELQRSALVDITLNYLKLWLL